MKKTKLNELWHACHEAEVILCEAEAAIIAAQVACDNALAALTEAQHTYYGESNK